MNELAASITDGLELPPAPPPALAGRETLLRELRKARAVEVQPGTKFLIVINIADIMAYGDFIRIFGHKFAEDMLGIRVDDLGPVTQYAQLYHIGFWSIGFIYTPESPEASRNFFDALSRHLKQPIICRGVALPIKAGIGVCDLQKAQGAAEDVLQSAFLAGQVSSRAATSWSFCDYEVAADHRRAFTLIADIAYSLSQGSEFELCFQPRLDLRTGKWATAEALLRWRHPELGLIMPDEFLPMVEMTGLLRQLTEWVLMHAIAKAYDWQRRGLKLRLAVNISVRNLEEEDFVRRLALFLEKFEFPPGDLELELSEHEAIAHPEIVRARLHDLRALGINLALDHFGTGSDSFKYLQTMPVNIMKIGPALLASMKEETRNQTLVQSMIGLAKRLGLEVVGEGVETREELENLARWGCTYAQGYYLARPMFIAEFETWFARGAGSAGV